MEAKLREDLLRKYTQFLEDRLEEPDGGPDQAGLLSVAAALLDPSQRFRLLRFYEVAENALRTMRGSSLQALEAAFAMLETVCTNLLLFPWKKEFRRIKVRGHSVPAVPNCYSCYNVGILLGSFSCGI